MDARITDEPAKARTDLPPASPPGGATGSRPTDGSRSAGASRPVGASRSIGADAVRRAGAGLTAGALTWAAAISVFGSTGVGVGERVVDLTGLCFQLGVFCLLWVQMRTRALGTSRAAAVALRVEAVVLGVASVWSLLHGVLPDDLKNGAWLAPLDMCWPLSMLGMAAISVKLAAAGRWRGLLRWWPLVAESWAVVTVPSFLLVGEDLSRWVGAGHLVIGYAALGLLLVTRPDDVLNSGKG
ncbi:hypothetical protein [Nonomuraea roseoviolacea]|uniref:Uncharacterized protein n=1 Tax=Nonomuraea roseoviolacea subsp. carminata TaxID=160689 RepID=A0ABT1JXX8_9ACTN|nr:hypothetical protein [Nonomuraea roseoviolacea]MCP2346601.1 hypothetical protein [Nonomuraea roseoviolacea subsp. carminata]